MPLKIKKERVQNVILSGFYAWFSSPRTVKVRRFKAIMIRYLLFNITTLRILLNFVKGLKKNIRNSGRTSHGFSIMRTSYSLALLFLPRSKLKWKEEQKQHSKIASLEADKMNFFLAYLFWILELGLSCSEWFVIR